MFGILGHGGKEKDAWSMASSDLLPASRDSNRRKYHRACQLCRARKLRCTGQLDGCDRCRASSSTCKYPSRQAATKDSSPDGKGPVTVTATAAHDDNGARVHESITARFHWSWTTSPRDQGDKYGTEQDAEQRQGEEGSQKNLLADDQPANLCPSKDWNGDVGGGGSTGSTAGQQDWPALHEALDGHPFNQMLPQLDAVDWGGDGSNSHQSKDVGFDDISATTSASEFLIGPGLDEPPPTPVFSPLIGPSSGLTPSTDFQQLLSVPPGPTTCLAKSGASRQDCSDCLQLAASLMEDLENKCTSHKSSPIDVLLRECRGGLKTATLVLSCTNCKGRSEITMMLSSACYSITTLCRMVVSRYLTFRGSLPSSSGDSEAFGGLGSLMCGTYKVESTLEWVEVLRSLARVLLADLCGVLDCLKTRAREGHMVKILECERRVKLLEKLLAENSDMLVALWNW